MHSATSISYRSAAMYSSGKTSSIMRPSSRITSPTSYSPTPGSGSPIRGFERWKLDLRRMSAWPAASRNAWTTSRVAEIASSSVL